MLRYGFNRTARLTEEDPRATDETAKRLFAAWARFWETDRRVLVEKSPPNLIKMRFLQRVFGVEHTRFIVTLRHPFAVLHFLFRRGDDTAQLLTAGCMGASVRHWLSLNNRFVEDLKHLKADNVLVLQFEHFLGAGLQSAAAGEARMQSLIDQVYAFLGLAPQQLHFVQEGGDEGTATDSPPGERQRRELHKPENVVTGLARRLLGYHGSREHVAVQRSDPNAWVTDFHRVVDHGGVECQRLASGMEKAVARFGYSLQNLTALAKPDIPGARVLWDA